MPLRQKIGSNLYLYQMYPKSYCDDLVISAHGGYDPNTPQFIVPAWPRFEALLFYVGHNKPQGDFGLGAFAGVERTAVEPPKRRGDDCCDYLLSKYQGRHSNDAETYDSIEQDMTAAVEAVTKYQDGMRNPRTQTVYAMKTAPRVFDVLTIRNRLLSGDQNLKSVLDRSSST